MPYEKYFKKRKALSLLRAGSSGGGYDFSSEPDYLTLSCPVQEPINVVDREFHSIEFKHYAFDPNLTPEGKTVVEVIYMSDNFEYWEELHSDLKAYKQEKARILEVPLNVLDERFPGSIDKVGQSDVDNLHFSAMWIMASGWLPTAVKTFRDILRLICKKEDGGQRRRMCKN